MSSNDVAIVGMACIFPGAGDLRAYWQNIASKFDAVGDPPEDWEAKLVFDPASSANDRVYTTKGGYLGDLAKFDPIAYGVVPNSIDGGEPDQFLALRVAHEALDDAGYSDKRVSGEQVQVIIGRGTYINRGFTNVVQHGMVVDQVLRILKQLHPEHSDEELSALKTELKESLPPFNGEMAPGLVPNIMSGRIANRLNLMGTNYTVDAACASSLIALDLAMGDLRSGKCDLALAGGVHASTPAPILQIFCQLGALSRRGELRPFDEGADGTLLGEGLGFVVLKRLEDAIQDGDRVYCTVKAVGSASDGRALGLLAPRVEGEELALRRAYLAAGLLPETVGLIEAHGTGTVAGDAAEIEALSRVFGLRGPAASRCALGTVKSMISHLIPAAGIAGVIKTALALHHKVLPPTLHCERPNPALKLDKTPFYMNTETRPWIHGAPTPRRAGVNAFGFGGINAHAILQEHLHPEVPAVDFHQTWDSEVVIVQGESRRELTLACKQLAGYLSRGNRAELKDVAFSLNCDLSDDALSLCLVPSTLEDLGIKLATAIEHLEDPSCRRIRDRGGIYFFEDQLGRSGSVAFAFPGEGSQYPNMLLDLCLHFSEVREWFDLIDRAFAGHARGFLPSQAIFPEPPMGGVGNGGAPPTESRLWQMDCGPEAIFAANQGLASLLGRLELRPDAVVGHSTGEYSALVAAGAHLIDHEELVGDMLGLNALYEQALSQGLIPEGVLLTVGGGSRQTVTDLVQQAPGELFVAMDNCPNQTVLCGNSETTGWATDRLRAAGLVCLPLPFQRAYHTPLFEPFCRELTPFFDRLKIGPPKLKLYSCTTAELYPAAPSAVRKLASYQWARPVRFRETIEAMYEAGTRVFVEVGPRGNLTSFVDDTLRGRPYLAVASNLRERSGIAQLHHLLAQLVAHGVPVKLDHLYARREPRKLDLLDVRMHEPPAVLTKLSMGLQPLRLRSDRELVPSVAAKSRENGHGSPAQNLSVDPTLLPSSPPPPNELVTQSATSAVMAEYLSTMDRFVLDQAEIMKTYLGGGHYGDSASEPSEEHAPEPAQTFPLLGNITSLIVGKMLTAQRRIDPHHDLYLKDHTLGGTVSEDDEELLALPIVPLTISVESMAEAAAALFPGRLVVGMKDVHAHRWIALDDGSVTLTITAQTTASPTEIGVRIDLAEPDGSAPVAPAGPVVEGTVILGDAYPSAPVASDLGIDCERPSRLPSDQLYGELMFHGPCFQAVTSIDRTGADGIQATLTALPADRLLVDNAGPHLLIDPVLLDAAGQVIAYWTAEHLDRAFHVFPFRMETLQVFQPRVEPGVRVECRARVALEGDGQVRSDIDLVGPDGHVIYRLEGWWDRRFDQPPNFVSFQASPRDHLIAPEWNAPLAGIPDPGELSCCLLLTMTSELLEAYGSLWYRALKHLVLSRRELEYLANLQGNGSRKREWLLGRSAVKDAVRTLVLKRHGITVLPADIDIGIDEHGRPHPTGSWVTDLAEAPVISIAHTDGIAVALAGSGEKHRGVGIDLEKIRSLSSGFGSAAFAAEEQAYLSSLHPATRQQWAIRLWCAKEAAGKALGRGLLGNPKGLVAQHWDGESGRIDLLPSQSMTSRLPELTGQLITAFTFSENNLVVATCLTDRAVT